MREARQSVGMIHGGEHREKSIWSLLTEERLNEEL